ncbi:glucosyl-3-phosphoglycerate synthase [Jatrophihabitans sp. DSM 45814]
MHPAARRWFDTHTFAASDFSVENILAAKAHTGSTVSVVIPARNEAATVATVVTRISEALVGNGVVDELVVIDSDSTDDTAALATAAGATVYASSSIDTSLSTLPGKGEALWRSLFVTSGDIVAFIDADLTEWGAHFVTGLLGPMLLDEKTLLVKGFYDRLFDSGSDAIGVGAVDAGDTAAPQGGRVTELVARPLINLHWPVLAGVVQPLAGEWAIRRSLAESLPFPVGYGIEFATLVDTMWGHGLDAVAQVDLGRRGHSHQNVHDLGVMATEILSTATRRMNRPPPPAPVGPSPVSAELFQYDRDTPGFWRARPVPLAERPPASRLESYRSRRGA